MPFSAFLVDYVLSTTRIDCKWEYRLQRESRVSHRWIQARRCATRRGLSPAIVHAWLEPRLRKRYHPNRAAAIGVPARIIESEDRSIESARAFCYLVSLPTEPRSMRCRYEEPSSRNFSA
jgi:hypothetical protein